MPISEEILYLEIKSKRDAGKPFRKIAEGYHTELNKSINHGDIYRILEGKFPIHSNKRAALGLSPICPICKQSLNPAPIPKPPRKRRKKSLMDYSDKELRFMFENREEIKLPVS